MTEEESNAKCDAIRQIAYKLHVYLGTGYLEKVYENGLAHRLSKAGFNVQTQVPITGHPRASSAKTRGFHTQLDEGPETP